MDCLKTLHILELHGEGSLYGGASKHTSQLINNINPNNIYLIFDKKNIFLKNKVLRNKSEINFSSLNPFIIIINILFISYICFFKKINIIHTHNRNDVIYAFLLNKFFKINYVHTVHGNLPSSSKFFLINYLFQNAINSAKSKVYISNFVKQKCLNYKWFKSKDSDLVIYNGSDGPKYTLRHRDIKIILWIGNLEHGVKQPDILLNIIELLNKKNLNYNLFIAGNGALLNYFKNNLNYSNYLKIKLLGYVDDIEDLISKSHIIITTSILEGFGRTITEAFSYSKPVIAFDSGGPKEIIINNYNGFLIPCDDINCYIDKIVLLFDDNIIYEKFSSNAYSTWFSKFQTSIFIENYISLFNKIK
jgi:glycosyltransferase involved in cell wall biosynthesis